MGAANALPPTLREEPEPEPRDWALFAYLCGDNPKVASSTTAQLNDILAVGAAPGLYVAVQWDLPGGGARAVAGGPGNWALHEELGAVNTGDPKELSRFLEWAFERCPSRNVAVVLSGTGLLDARAATGRPDTDRTRIFTIADDATAGDALALSELRAALADGLATSPRDAIDLLAFDMRELQFIEVAYELDGVVKFLVGPQTRVPDSGWNFREVLQTCHAQVTALTTPVQMARLLVETVAREYARGRTGELSLSALDLSVLDEVAAAFDTLSLGVLHSLGEELVWHARAEVARQLKKDPRAGSGQTDQIHAQEEDWLYDLGEMLTRLKGELDRATVGGLGHLVSVYLARLDLRQLRDALQSLDRACFRAGAQLRHPELEGCIADPRGIRRRLRQLIRSCDLLLRAEEDPNARAALHADVQTLLMCANTSPIANRTWLDDWPDGVVENLWTPLAAEYRVARRQQQRAEHLALLAKRVIGLLEPQPAPASSRKTLVVAHKVEPPDAERPQHCGVSLFRPRELDYLSASDYLSLQFNKRIHWTVLLAVVNMIGKHPRALWRILSAALATADTSTRAELLGRIVGPDSVVGSFREQFLVLAPLAALTLSVEPDTNGAGPPKSSRRRKTRSLPDPAKDVEAPDTFRVRLERSGRDPLIDEVTSRVDSRARDQVLNRLVEVLKRDSGIGAQDVRFVEAGGRNLGEDVLRHLGIKLGDEALKPRPGGLHLQLQIPRSLMPYPWELVQHKYGWLSEHYAIGRQVFSGSRRIKGRVRRPGPLRVLVIANPLVRSPHVPGARVPSLPAAAEEGKTVMALFERLASETDGLVDFDPASDAFISADVSTSQVRELLRRRAYDIIHFAGHATFDAAVPERSAWRLSDGDLTAQTLHDTFEWAELQPWLVFANACEAGMDAQHPDYQRDVFGLASAFLNNGVAAYVAPLWPINDGIAAEIAHRFYDKLLKDRQTVGEALRLAKVWAKTHYYDPVRDQRASADGATPSTAGVALLSWAGLVLYGNSTATIGQRIGAPTSAVAVKR